MCEDNHLSQHRKTDNQEQAEHKALDCNKKYFFNKYAIN